MLKPIESNRFYDVVGPYMISTVRMKTPRDRCQRGRYQTLVMYLRSGPADRDFTRDWRNRTAAAEGHDELVRKIRARIARGE